MIVTITRQYLWLVALASLVSLVAGVAVGAASWPALSWPARSRRMVWTVTLRPDEGCLPWGRKDEGGPSLVPV